MVSGESNSVENKVLYVGGHSGTAVDHSHTDRPTYRPRVSRITV